MTEHFDKCVRKSRGEEQMGGVQNSREGRKRGEMKSDGNRFKYESLIRMTCSKKESFLLILNDIK